jgi:hypothetical protein
MAARATTTKIYRLESYDSQHLVLTTDTVENNSKVQVLSDDLLPANGVAAVKEGFNPSVYDMSGITWNDPEFYVCDETQNEIYRLADHDPSTIAGTYTGFGDSVSDIAKGCEAWSCGQEGGVGKIWLHWDLNDPIERAEFNSPDNNPSGLACGSTGYLWSCDRVTGKIYKHAYAISPHALTVAALYIPTYVGGEKPEALAWDGTTIWSGTDAGHIYKHNAATLEIEETWTCPSGLIPYGLVLSENYLWSCCHVPAFPEDRIYQHERLSCHSGLSGEYGITTLKHGSTVYIGTDSGKLYSYDGSVHWLATISVDDILGLFLLDGDMYAGTSADGKLFKWVAGAFIEVLELTDEQAIYAGCNFDGAMYIGTQSNAPEAAGIYKNSSSGLGGEQFAVTDDYKWLRLPFTLTSADADNTIRFTVLKDGTAALWTNVDILLVAPR